MIVSSLWSLVTFNSGLFPARLFPADRFPSGLFPAGLFPGGLFRFFFPQDLFPASLVPGRARCFSRRFFSSKSYPLLLFPCRYSSHNFFNQENQPMPISRGPQLVPPPKKILLLTFSAMFGTVEI